MTCLRNVIIISLAGLAFACCPDGWRKGENSCYFISPGNATWSQASNICRAFSGELAVIDDAAENALLGRIINNLRGAFKKNFWIDGSDAVTEGIWYWASTMESFGFTNWAIGEPNNQGEVEDCVELYLLDFVWNDNHCNLLNHFICEKEIASPSSLTGQLIG